jgi:mannose-6-phosphate isomerase-like protein (cupin superfamily)
LFTTIMTLVAGGNMDSTRRQFRSAAMVAALASGQSRGQNSAATSASSSRSLRNSRLWREWAGDMSVRYLKLVLLFFLAALTPAAFAQSGTDTATDISKAELDALAASSTGDHQAKVVDIGKLNVGVGVVRRNATKDKPGDPVNGIYHDSTSEVYYILSGSGTLTTGGTVSAVRRSAVDSDVVKVLNGPSGSGVSQGGHSRVVGPGDMIVIPAGVFHGWSQIADHVTYMTVRPDPDRVLPAGYINPAIAGMEQGSKPARDVGK